MASSSTPTSTNPIQQKYDVFVSFRGSDTRDNITSHVYAALCRAKIKTFIDNDLKRGYDVSDALLKTIAESKISLVIFSENYASSKWCLDELLRIMECNKENGQIVIPVFYKVDPSHVRNQSDSFGQALAWYEGHPKIHTWRDALTKAANLSGWDSHVTRHEATLIKSIVTDILGKLNYTSSSNFGNLVGMSSHFEQIESLLSMINKDVRIIGLWGMGGIGKTTLARAFFNYNFSKFERHCIIEYVRETCEKRGLSELREKLVIGLLKDGNLNVGTPNLGIPFIRDRLCRMKVLIVLDDVSDFQQIELLVGWHDCLGPGSIVIITSRDKQVFKNGVDRIYDVPELDYNESLCLFSQYAFKQELPPEDHHMRLSNRAINYAKGHPLALKILGSHLCGRSKQEQESALMKLERNPNIAVQQVLLISYAGLDHQEKDLFLNIACLFRGGSVNEVKWFHDACNYSTDIELAVLIDKSLITIRTGRIWMHDLLQEMGRQIVREESKEPGKRSRLWDHHDICDVLTMNTGTLAVKGILLDMCKLKDLSINPVALQRMHNLEFFKIRIHLSAVRLLQGLKSLPNKLRYLYWDRYPLTYLPINFYPENLVSLKMPNSCVKRLWNGRQNLVHLKEMDLSFSKNLIDIPDLSLATNLQKLLLYGCFLIKKFPKVSLKIQCLGLGGTAIEEVPSTICNLKSLILLELGGSTRLKNLTSIYKLKPLWHFGLCCPSKKREHQQEVNIHLRELTDHLVWLSSLQSLNLSRNNFQKIPFAIKQLTNLIFLNLNDCKRLQSLPQLPMNVRCMYAANCISLEMVASPLSTTARGVFDDHQDYIWFDFANCCKLDKNAINSTAADVESRLRHWEVTYPETLLSKNTGAACMVFSGGDVPDWFDYKSSGSSLTAKLSPHWCNDELFCLIFCVVIEFKQFPSYCKDNDFYYNCRIRNKVGDSFSANGDFGFTWRFENAIQSSQVFLVYDQSLVNNWRITGEAYDGDEISIEFCVGEDSINCCTVKKCGVHLVYTQEIEDRYCGSVIQPNSLCGDLTQFSLKQYYVDDVKELVIQDAKDNVSNPVEDSASVRRKEMETVPLMFRNRTTSFVSTGITLKDCSFTRSSAKQRASP
ncbi:disease resistance-like protein DSC1 [Tripterygium wilfordii]|uniref:disease resistance-like protein DSC1 n=1 Tax=Tripterygium wilfordii TaxID=458696 RepID=UPI0018F83D3F|nr:disease resistance-like protein DSC1 [Tripterygium wilfordii]